MEKTPSVRRLVAVGVADYESETLPNLPAVPAAVEAVVTVLAHFDYRRELSNLGLNPSRRQLDQLERFCRERAGDEVLIVYYTGHGDVIDGRHMLQSSDFDHAMPDAGSLHAEGLGRWLGSKSDRAVLLLLDTCYAASDAEAILGAFLKAFPNFPVNLAIVVTAMRRQYAYEGRFAAALKHALEQAPRSRKCGGPESALLSLDGVIDIVNDRMAEVQARDGGEQRARLLAIADGVLPFFPNPNYRPDLPPLATLAEHNRLLGNPVVEQTAALNQCAQDLLTTLAFAPGSGLPFEQILRVACTAVTGGTYSDTELDTALQTTAANVTVDADHGTTLYRLADPEHAKRLRWGQDECAVNKRLALAFMQLIPVLDSQSELRFAHPYLRKHLPALALAAGLALLAGAALSTAAVASSASLAAGGTQAASSVGKLVATAKAAVASKVAVGVGIAAIATAGVALRPTRMLFKDSGASHANAAAPPTRSSKIGGNDVPVMVAQAEIRLDQSVNVGAFAVQLGSARLGADPTASKERLLMNVDFTATNLTQSLATPFSIAAEFHSEAILFLDYGGQTYSEPELAVHAVPAGRMGVGSLKWKVHASATSADASLRDVTLRIGQKNQNQVIVPFSNLSDTVTLADLLLTAPQKLAGFRSTTVDVKKAYVTFVDRNRNRPLWAGTGWMVLDVIMTHDESRGEVSWTVENNFLERPDHASVVSGMCLDFAVLNPGQSVECSLAYDIIPPYVGEYTFGLMGRGLAPVTRSIVVR